jgi:hypothetical protein
MLGRGFRSFSPFLFFMFVDPKLFLLHLLVRLTAKELATLLLAPPTRSTVHVVGPRGSQCYSVEGS